MTASQPYLRHRKAPHQTALFGLVLFLFPPFSGPAGSGDRKRVICAVGGCATERPVMQNRATASRWILPDQSDVTKMPMQVSLGWCSQDPVSLPLRELCLERYTDLPAVGRSAVSEMRFRDENK